MYCLAALKAKPSSRTSGHAVQALADIATKKLTKFTPFFSQLSLFSKGPNWKLQFSSIEGYLFYPQLSRMSLDIFPRQDTAKDESLEYIPLTWTATNYRQATPLSANFLWDMMAISTLNYQADEYMEVVVREHFVDDLKPIKQPIHRLRDDTVVLTDGATISARPVLNGDRTEETKKRRHPESDGQGLKESNRLRSEVIDSISNGHVDDSQTLSDGISNDLSEVSQILTGFITHVLNHQHILHASAHELRTFLLAHITQNEDNTFFSSQAPAPASLNYNSSFQNPVRSYYSWTQNTSAVRTSCPYSFAFVACLTENVNSVNFPEFHERPGENANGKVSEDGIKQTLFDIAVYEVVCPVLA